MATRSAGRALEKRLEGAAWGTLLIWIGVVLLASLGWAAFLVGVGGIIVGVQASRKIFGLPFEAFWVAVAVLFLMGGLWDLVQVRVGLVPILCIAGGILLLASALAGRHRHQQG